jgi:tetratricopeptide (TPR) repeat protein
MNESPIQPKLSDLLSRYLDGQADAVMLGAGPSEHEVTPYESGPVQPIDAKVAWDEAVAVLPFYGSPSAGKTWKAPPQWTQLVAGHEPAVALAFSLGNFPQLVRNFHLLLQQADLSELRPQPRQAVPSPELMDWAAGLALKARYPQVLLALGTLRLAKQFDAAEQFAKERELDAPAEWRDSLANERAALAWHMGRAEEARALWQKITPSAPVLFNRGMAALFLNQPADAREPLSVAVARLPEQSAWHHLGRLYLTLAQERN